MNWKHFWQLLIALVALVVCIWLGRLIWPALQAMAPVLAWTIMLAAEIIIVSVAVGVPAFVFVYVRGHHRAAEVKIIEARKLHVTDRGYIQGYVTSSPKDRILVPQLSAYSQEVPGHVHIQEDNSNSASAANELRREQFEWKKHIDMLRLNPPVTPQEETKALAIPEAPGFQEVIPYIKTIYNEKNKEYEDQVVLAYGALGVVLGTVLDWLSTLVVGLPGNGKSTLLYFFIAQLMILRAKFQVLDPAGSLVNLKDVLPYVNRHDACIRMASVIESELEERIVRFENNGGVCLDDHYMLIIDELPAIADREQQIMAKMDRKEKAMFRSLIDVIRRVVCEGRKYKMYCVVVGQSIPATILPTIARDNMSSRYVFYCQDRAARMAGLDEESIENYLPLLHGKTGRCVVAPAKMDSFLGAIPLTEITDLRHVVESTGYVRDGYESPDGNGVEDDTEPLVDYDEDGSVNTGKLGSVSAFSDGNSKQMAFSGNGNTETPLPDGITDFMLSQIRGMYNANWPLREIAKRVHLDGRKYWKFQAACKYLGIAQAVGQEA